LIITNPLPIQHQVNIENAFIESRGVAQLDNIPPQVGQVIDRVQGNLFNIRRLLEKLVSSAYLVYAHRGVQAPALNCMNCSRQKVK